MTQDLEIKIKLKYKDCDGIETIDIFIVPCSELVDGYVNYMKQMCTQNNWTYVKAVQVGYWCDSCGKEMTEGLTLSTTELDNDPELTPRNIGTHYLCNGCYKRLIKHIMKCD